VSARTLIVASQRPLDAGGGGSARWRHLREALAARGWRVVECSGRLGIAGDESSTDSHAASLAAGRAQIATAAGRMLDPVARLANVTPEAFAPNNLWALTGRRAVRAAIERERPDVVVATSPPPSALLAAAGVVVQVPLVAELRDLWAGNPFYDRGSGLLRAAQRRALARAAAVVTVSDGCRAVLCRIDPDLDGRLHVLPNGFDPDLLKRRSAPPGQDPRVLIHAGSLYGDRTAETLLDALERPSLRQRVRLHLVGVVDPRTRSRLSHTTVAVATEPPVSWNEAIELLLASDIAVVINAPSTGGDMALPGKLFEALAVGRPVLALTNPASDTARLLERLGQDAGVAAPDDADAVAAAIERLLDEPPPPVPPEALAEFDRDGIAERYAALLDEVATRSSNATSSGTKTSRR
jgi:glycosyltransferase involved in cell wall biosynthesis